MHFCERLKSRGVNVLCIGDVCYADLRKPSVKIAVAMVTVSYPGGRFSPEDGGDSLSHDMLKSAFDDYSYRYEPDAEQSNTVEMLIREKGKA